MMRLAKYLLVPWAAVVVYSFAAVFSGSSGIGSYRSLLHEREKLITNLERLQQLNRELEGSMDALLYDSETIRIKARELGYGRSEERFLRIVGLPSSRSRPLQPGIVRNANQPFFVTDHISHLASLCTALILLALFITIDSLRKVHTPRDSTLRKSSCP
ncbi:MAG: septum formation initiator family protein [Treponema sp.]|jgi:cell division protein FtsB|nr:septum formation initiator family protein [Treponema sp.]